MIDVPRFFEIRSGSLDMANTYRLTQLGFAMTAFVFARARANSAQHSGKDVYHTIYFVGIAELALVDPPDVTQAR